MHIPRINPGFGQEERRDRKIDPYIGIGNNSNVTTSLCSMVVLVCAYFFVFLCANYLSIYYLFVYMLTTYLFVDSCLRVFDKPLCNLTT